MVPAAIGCMLCNWRAGTYNSCRASLTVPRLHVPETGKARLADAILPKHVAQLSALWGTPVPRRYTISSICVLMILDMKTTPALSISTVVRRFTLIPKCFNSCSTKMISLVVSDRTIHSASVLDFLAHGNSLHVEKISRYTPACVRISCAIRIV